MWICKDRSGRLQTPQVEKGLKCLTAQCNGVDQESLSRSTGKRCYLASLFISLFYRSSKLLIVAHYHDSKDMFLPGAIICPSQFITGANQEFTIAERQLQRTWAATRTFYFDTFCPRLKYIPKALVSDQSGSESRVETNVQMVSWVPVWPASCSTRFLITMMMRKIHLVIVTVISSRGRSFPIGAFTKGLTNCIGVSSTNRLW